MSREHGKPDVCLLCKYFYEYAPNGLWSGTFVCKHPNRYANDRFVAKATRACRLAEHYEIFNVENKNFNVEDL